MTIRRRVRTALLLMLVIPLLLMGGTFSVLRIASARASGPDPTQQALLAALNRLVNEDPGALADPRTLSALDRRIAAPGGWAVLKNGTPLYQSPSLAAAHRRLSRTWRPPWSTLPASRFRWEFRFPDGSAGTLLFYPAVSWPSQDRGPVWVFAFIALLAVCNVLLGWWVTSSVVSPLSKLRDAALRIGEGDLDFALDASGPEEFGQVMSAFETMREKLHTSLERQLAEEGSRKELIAHVSHDLRTPIGLIRGYAEGLRDGVAATGEMRSRYLATILERTGELERLIEALFSYSTLDLESFRPNVESVEVVPYLRELCDSLGGMFPAARLRLASSGGGPDGEPLPDGLRIRADRELTRRVLTNLVENAVTHGGQDSIAVEWRLTRPRPGGPVEIHVRDDGIGVAREDLPRIFEPFFRTDPARTRRAGATGAGLGLSIVGAIMQRQGGSVRAEVVAPRGLDVILSFAEATGSVETDPDHRG